jgi:hypothetical protein
MQQRLDRMQGIADRLAQTDDPAERRALMQEHRQAMQETRSMMGAMQGGMGMHGNMPAGKGGMGMMGSGMGMMGGQSGMMPMMQRMEAMHARMDQIMETEDPAKRQELIKETRQQMQDAMGMMRHMQQGGDMGMGMMGKGSMPMGQQAQVHAGMVEAFRQMDKRLDLMQQMLERLMQQQN